MDEQGRFQTKDRSEDRALDVHREIGARKQNQELETVSPLPIAIQECPFFMREENPYFLKFGITPSISGEIRFWPNSLVFLHIYIKHFSITYEPMILKVTEGKRKNTSMVSYL